MPTTGFVGLREVRDFNNDGHLDVLLGQGTAPQTFAIWRGDGSGRFVAPTLPIAVAGAPVQAFDQDADADVDLLWRGTAGELILLRNDGTGQFVGVPIWAGPVAGSAAIADFNNDTRPDIAVSLAPTAAYAVLLLQADGSYSAPVTHATGAAPGLRAAGDFNEDGRVDLLIGEGTSLNGGRLTVAFGSPSGFGPQVVVHGAGHTRQPWPT